MPTKPSSPALKRLFNDLNTHYWEGALPANTIVRWGTRREMTEGKGKKKKEAWGFFYYDDANIPTILLTDEMRRRNWGKTAESTLLHEMVHLSTKGRDSHRKVFIREMRRLVNAGAFDKIL